MQRPHTRKRKREGLVQSPAESVPNTTAPPRRSPLRQATSTREPSYLGRADYLDTHAPIDEDDASQYPRSPTKSTIPQDLATRHVGLDDLMSRSARESLISSFLKRCRPWMPLVNAEEVTTLFSSNANANFLMLAILVAGSKVSTMPKAHDLGQRCYDLAKLRFYAGREVDSIEVIIGSVFLQWWNQTGPEHISIDNSSFWLRIAVALAHQTGLHKEPDNHNMQRALRRRLWWALVVSGQLLRIDLMLILRLVARQSDRHQPRPTPSPQPRRL